MTVMDVPALITSLNGTDLIIPTDNSTPTTTTTSNNNTTTGVVVPTLRRSSSAFARSSQPSPMLMLAGAGPHNHAGSLMQLDMAVCGVPPPVGVKKERVPVVVSVAPPRTSRVSGSTPKKAAVDVSPYLSGSSPVKKTRRSSKAALDGREEQQQPTSSSSADGLTDDADDADSKVEATSSPSFSATGPTTTTTKPRTRSQSLRPSTQQRSNDNEGSLASTRDNGIAKSMTLRPRESRPRQQLTESVVVEKQQRSRSLTNLASKTIQPHSDSSQTTAALVTARKQAVAESAGSGASAAAALRKLFRSEDTTTKSTTTLSSSLKTAPVNQGPPAIKKYIVEANAYHCTFVQSMMMSRGPEWKATCRTATTISASDIAQCAFVWFKFEHMKSIPYVDRVRLPANIIEKLKTRSAEMLHLFTPGEKYPDHSSDPVMVALDLLNAYVIPEEPETPANSAPLVNIARTRMPNMVLCEKSYAHHVGALPSGTDPEVVKAFDQLKTFLHYHHLKYTKGTPIIACFKEASAVWRKHLLYRYMKQYCDNDPERRGSVRERCPASFEFDLNRPEAEVREDALLFMNTLMSEHGVVRWLAKATGGANGNGFYVTKDPEDMVRYVSGQSKKAGGESDFWIIQEFVEKMPLLFDGHRFHMKVHVVMIATAVGLDFYAYKKQRIQCCSEQFDPDVMHPLSYIGNWGQQRFATNLVQEKFSTLLEDIKSEYPQLIPAWHRAKLLIAEAVEAAWRCGRAHFDFTPGCYELMGWDFVMEECPDGTWRPLLVEANHRPGFGSERKYMEKQIHEVLELVMYPVNGLTKHHKDVHNGVVEAIWDHVKTIVIHPFEQPTAAQPEVVAETVDAAPTTPK